MSWITSLFCKHKWKVHNKKEGHAQTWALYSGGIKYEPTGIIERYTIEIMICEKCGKIKKIKY